MNNEDYLKILYDKFSQMRNFSIKNNILFLQHNNSYYQLPIPHLNLASLNPNLFYLSNVEIFRVLYMLELFYKPELSLAETTFIKEYLQVYLNINDQLLGGNSNFAVVDSGLKIPILMAYREDFANTPCGKIIENTIINHESNNLSGKNKQLRLVRTKETIEDFFPIPEENDFVEYSKYGFTTLVLIGVAALATAIYIIYFMSIH